MMKILITGASGLIGQALCQHLRGFGYQVGELKRVESSLSAQPPYWNIAAREVNLGEFDNVEVIIHLAGESIADGRWSAARMQRIMDSRVESTQLLVETINRMAIKPRLLISASAIGFYGDRGADEMDELSSRGEDFVSQVALHWERASQAVDSSVRLVNIRTGLVLAANGGALAKMLLPFKLGLGGKIGSGKQYMSWISIVDVCRAIEFIIDHRTIRGAVNLVSPNAVTNSEFTRGLGDALKRPTFFAMPSFVARVVFGKMADELLLSSTKVKPRALIEMGFEFKHLYLPQALQDTI